MVVLYQGRCSPKLGELARRKGCCLVNLVNLVRVNLVSSIWAQVREKLGGWRAGIGCLG